VGRDGESFKSDLGQTRSGIFLQTGLDRFLPDGQISSVVSHPGFRFAPSALRALRNAPSPASASEGATAMSALPDIVRFDPLGLHRSIGMTHLRHATVERHMGMHAKPTIGIPGKHQGGPAGARKRVTIEMIADARPRRDHGRHHAVGRRQNRGLLKDEAEVSGLRPDIVPLRRDPFIQARDDIVVRAEGKHIRMKERPRRGVVDLTDIAREGFQPLAEELRYLCVRGRQSIHCLLHMRLPNGSNLIATNRSWSKRPALPIWGRASPKAR